MFYQGRGPIFLAKRNAAGIPGAYFELCTDTLSIALATTSFSHTNKCGPVDVEDARGTKDQTASLSLTFANVEDRNYALGVLGSVTPQGSPGTVTDEELPQDLVAGDVYFLGGLTRHRTITGLVLDGLVLDDDYTLEPLSGRVTFLTDAPSGSPAITAAYGYTDPPSVSLFTSPTAEYALMQENINKQNANKPGSFEAYRVRFDPVKNLDLQSDEFQIMELAGSVLADLNKPIDTEFGQFGRRVL